MVASRSLYLPLSLSIIAGMGTLLGGVMLILLLPNPRLAPHGEMSHLPISTSSLLGRLEAAAAGVMLALSLNLLIESLRIISIWSGMCWVAVGAIVMTCIQRMIPHHHDDHSDNDKDHASYNRLSRSSKEYGRGTPLPQLESSGSHHDWESVALQAISDQNQNELDDTRNFNITNSTASPNSSSLSRTFMHRLYINITSISFWFGDSSQKTLIRTSLVTFFGLAIHNLPGTTSSLYNKLISYFP